MGLPHATPVPPSATTDLHHGGGRDDTRAVPSIGAGGTPHAGVSPPPAPHFADPPRSPFMSSGKMKKRSAHQASVDKNGRGLRQFSMKVCENVESKGVTTHNEVANALVAEFADPSGNLVSPDQQQYEDKNIRRRVYDALNVLIAMDIISRDKKEIQWKGLPFTSPNDDQALKVECSTRRNRIEKKAAYLEELEEQTHPRATVEVEISEDMQLVHFDFNSTPFELHDDIYVLKAMRFCERQGAGDSQHRIANRGKKLKQLSMYHHQTPTDSRPNQADKCLSSPNIPGIL